jgi:glutathione S-transferase
MTAVLWQLELSHYNEKARWALAYKGVEHERRTPMPGMTGPVALALTRGRHRRMPILQLDGRTIPDSTAIIAALEERHPAPPLYPEDPAERAQALELEEYFDEQLGPNLRRWVWHYTLDDTDAVVQSVFPEGDRPGRERLLRTAAPVMGPVIRRDFAITAASVEPALATLREVMDRIEREVGPSGYLVGDRFSVADLTGAALFTPLLCPPKREYTPKRQVATVAALREEFVARPGGEWVREMFTRHR